MKDRKLCFVSAAWLLAATLSIHITGGCTTHTAGPCCSSAETPGRFTDQSLYQLESQWTTDKQKQIQLGELAGRPRVVVMFFANCQYACPVIVNDLKRIEATLSSKARANVGFTLVTFDTERDTPAVLADYRQSRRLSDSTWTLLHGGPDDVLELGALLGVKYKQDARGQFSHSNVITLLNAQGEIVHQQFGLNQDVSETVRILEKLAVN